MAFTQLVASTNRSGTFTSPALSVPAGMSRVSVRLTSNSWPTGTGNSMAWAIDRSDDNGVSWNEITDGVTAEGALAKDGSMPEVVLLAPSGQAWPAFQLRARCRITGTLRFGLESEIL